MFGPLIAIISVSLLCLSHSFRLPPPASARLQRPKMTWVDTSSVLLNVGDYAAEIEKAVGEEIYGPIFKAGIFLFFSGIVSAFVAAAIISKSNSWEELGNEFERGKEAQLIALEELSDTKQEKNERPSSEGGEGNEGKKISPLGDIDILDI